MTSELIKPKKEIKEEINENSVIEKNVEGESKIGEPEKKEKIEQKKEIEKLEKNKIKKNEAIVKGVSVPISTKYAVNICRFIKNKSPENAIKDLELVLLHKKAIPMKGEYAHKKGIKTGGRYPKDASIRLIKIIKNLSSNAYVNGIENPIIFEAYANKAYRPRGNFGRWKRKRTNLVIKIKEKNSS